MYNSPRFRFLLVLAVLSTLLGGPPSKVSAAGYGLSPGTLTLTSTYNSIGIELPFTNDDNANAQASLEFKRSSDSTWRRGLQLWRTDDGSSVPGRAFYGSAMLLEPGTRYDVRVTLADPDGTSPSIVTSSVATRADDTRPASTLVPTHFVSVSGNDGDTGTSTSASWRTLEKAFVSAPSGAVVRVAPGSYAPPASQRTTPITLMAQNPAVDDSRAPINAGNRSVIEPQTISSPIGGSGAYVAPWVKVGLKGPATGATYSVWKWAASPLSSARRMTFAESQGTPPKRVAYWDRKSGTYGSYTMQTPEGWAEVLHKNDTYNYGFASFNSDVYVRMPGDLDPNQYYVTVAGNPRVGFAGPSTRLTGFELRATDISYSTNARFGVADHNFVMNGNLNYTGTQGPPAQYPSDHAVEFNLLRDTGTWSTNPSYPAIPWAFVKANIRIGGSSTSWGRVGAAAETFTVFGRGGARRLVFRYNTVEGYFNGVGGYNVGYDRYSQQDTDVYENTFRQIADDALEPEQQAINWRIWDNRIEHASVGMSTGPVDYGPLYMFRNEIWKLGNSGVGADNLGDKGVGVLGFKYSGSSTPPARVYVVHNTFWSDSAEAGGGAQWAGGGTSPERFWLRNNIFRMTRYAFEAPGGKWSEDYNHFATTDTTRGFAYAGTRYTTNVASYRSASGQGARTNIAGDFIHPTVVDGAMTNATAGDLSLRSGSVFVDAGTPVPNISDGSGQYSGGAPDLGANESGETAALPAPTTSPSPTVSPTPTTAPSPTATAVITEPAPTSTPTPDEGGTATLTPVADTYVQGNKSGTNFGAQTAVKTDTSPIQIGYVRFDLSSLAGKAIQKAVLRVSVTNGSPNTQVFKYTTDAWAERTLTYATRPAHGAQFATNAGGSAGSTRDIVLTAAAQAKAGGMLSFAIENTGSDSFDFSSRENTASAPKLTVTYGEGATSTPTPTATSTSSPAPTSTSTPSPTATPSSGQSVTSFTLINADTDQAIGTLVDGGTIDFSLLGTRNLNVIAKTSPSLVGSVRFAYDTDSDYRLENGAPYALEGNAGSDYYSWTPSLGGHTLTATPYSQSDAGGTAGTPLAIRFTVQE